MLGPHIFAGLPVSSRKSLVNSRQSASCRLSVSFARKLAALACVGFVLLAAPGISILGEFLSIFPKRRAQFRHRRRAHAMQTENLALRLLREFRERGQARPLERAPCGCRKTFHEPRRGLARRF